VSSRGNHGGYGRPSPWGDAQQGPLQPTLDPSRSPKWANAWHPPTSVGSHR